ncbi:rna 3 -terminal phosphate cyclase [Ophiostoma piceae UAMH 11346]|uniref:Rna 3-terminal phosphate cyclase n=1 Tax=Ophiostoma piceae (strain UAMH 11346) TaxID=1262450 RepID=S3C6L6_OPHP1|nr:rna 3 -terminal phosphate cyclase [Ophiostoma piceae UAMH 11346]
MLTIDGRVGEGGGQLVRTAAALAALSGQALRVDNVRGNRSSGGGLRPQHAAAILWLAEVTGAATAGIHTGSTTFTFRPKHRLLPAGCDSSETPIVLRAATEAASAALMLQTVLPYMLFGDLPQTAASPKKATKTETTAVHLALHGGTHVSNAPTYDYLDQVLFPTLEDWFGVRVERSIVQRCWNTGSANGVEGHIDLVIHRPPQLAPRVYSLASETGTPKTPEIVAVEATVYAPSEVLEQLIEALSHEASLCDALSRPDLQFRSVEESGHGSRLYVLLVARTAGDEANKIPVRRWGRDYLERGNILKAATKGRGPAVHSKKGKKGSKGHRAKEATDVPAVANFGAVCDRIAQRVVGYLAADVAAGGCGDEYLQDQVVVFQALAAGTTSFWRGQKEKEDKEKKEDIEDDDLELEGAVAKLKLDTDTSTADDMTAPFGEGSLHAATARWVTAELLSGVRWSSNGTVCQGAGWT